MELTHLYRQLWGSDDDRKERRVELVHEEVDCFEMEELVILLQQMKNNKAGCEDGLNAELLFNSHSH